MRFGPGSFLFLLPLILHAQFGGVITTIAGTGEQGFSGDGGPATVAALGLANLRNQCDPNQFEQTSHIAIDSKGVIYLADSSNQRIRRIDANGGITTIAGDGASPSTGCLSFNPVGDGANPLAAHFYTPADVLLRPNGNLLIADQQNNRIREITLAGAVSTIAGSGLHLFFSPGNTALQSPMDWPAALALDNNGLVLFSELHSNRVGRITADGRIVTAAGNGFNLSKPAGIAVDRQGNIYIADTGNNRLAKAAPNGTITTVAGFLSSPMDVKLDSRGNIYVADTGNHRIVRVDPLGNVVTVAGTGSPGRGADNVPANTSALNFPNAIALDAHDDLYIVDWQNFRIRKVTFATIDAVVDGASFTAAPAPGGIFTVFGGSLAPGLAQFTTSPLTTQLAGVSLRINGFAVPLYFVSPGQINAQLPYNAAPGPATAMVITPTGFSPALTFTIVPAAPAIFVAVKQDAVAVAYVTGLGAVTPPVATGAAAPAEPLSYANATVTATIGGLPAQVRFAGLAPGFIGLGQVNVLIPSGAADLTLILEINGQKSKPATIR
jgi:sugar lactone lactonase YvrE